LSEDGTLRFDDPRMQAVVSASGKEQPWVPAKMQRLVQGEALAARRALHGLLLDAP